MDVTGCPGGSHARPGDDRARPCLSSSTTRRSGPQPVTGNSVRETEAKIRSLLHMDYDTFVNSAFILQGRADMFTTSTPAKRKELLCEVLDLSRYDDLADKARAESRDRERSVERLEAEIEGIDRELSHKGERTSFG